MKLSFGAGREPALARLSEEVLGHERKVVGRLHLIGKSANGHQLLLGHEAVGREQPQWPLDDAAVHDTAVPHLRLFPLDRVEDVVHGAAGALVVRGHLGLDPCLVVPVGRHQVQAVAHNARRALRSRCAVLP